MKKIFYIDEVNITNKKILLRVDFNVSLNHDFTIADDVRIKQSLPTINYLLGKNNKLVLISHLDRPKTRNPKYSLRVVVNKLKEYLPNYKIKLVDDFLSEKGIKQVNNQKKDEILVLENIRFYKEEEQNDSQFAKNLASFANIFVNDAFGVCHRENASVVGVTNFIPSYGGLLLKKEIAIISKVLKNPKKPLVVIMGGAKISTKINLIGKLTEMADYFLIGGGLANTFLKTQRYKIGKSFCEQEKIESAKRLLFAAAQKKTAIILPSDVIVGEPENNENGGEVKKITEIPKGANILDIGPETQAKFGSVIAKAKTIIWNGPVGYFENPAFRRGTDFIYYAITQNQQATSIIGGGDTIAAISKKEYLDKITHVSTGGGAMLEFIEKGTLPGIEALKK